MNENTTVENGTTTPEAGAKTFTQEQLNAIVGERLAKEKAKADTALAEREQELAKREFQLGAKEKLTAKGLPLSLLDALDTSSAEAFDKALAIFEKVQNDTKPAPNINTDRRDKILHQDAQDVLRKGFGLDK